MSDELERSKRRLDAVQDPEVGERMLPRSLRNALIRELSPTRTERERVQAGIVAALGGEAASPFVKQVDASMATRAAHLKTATVVAGKSLATKVIVSSLVIASAAGVTTSLVHRTRKQASTESAAAAPARVERASRDASPVLAPSQPTTAPRPAGAAAPTGETVQPPDPSALAPAGELDAARESQPMAATGTEHPSGPVHRRRVERAPRSTVSQPPVATVAPSITAAEAPAAAPAPAPAVPQPALTLGDELSLVRGASDALDQHEPARALQLLARYAQNHPNGSLKIEADALRVMALCAAMRPEAAAARDAFLIAHPQSALARRIRSVCTW